MLDAVINALLFLSTPSARRATHNKAMLGERLGISIHALREEGDADLGALERLYGHFYPRPPRGGRPPLPSNTIAYQQFLSTPSARRATDYGNNTAQIVEFLSTPSARRATFQAGLFAVDHDISIHALREEGDYTARYTTKKVYDFYPRPPRGGRPSRLPKTYTEYIFLSTPSARRATRANRKADPDAGFLSTPSARRATNHARVL